MDGALLSSEPVRKQHIQSIPIAERTGLPRPRRDPEDFKRRHFAAEPVLDLGYLFVHKPFCVSQSDRRRNNIPFAEDEIDTR